MRGVLVYDEKERRGEGLSREHHVCACILCNLSCRVGPPHAEASLCPPSRCMWDVRAEKTKKMQPTNRSEESKGGLSE